MAYLAFRFRSIVDDILKRDKFFLVDLLDEDETVAEVKSQKEALLDFLCQPSVVDDLITYVVENPPSDADEKEKFRYPAVACEILCAGATKLENSVVENEENLERLFGFFEETKINLLLANCVVKVINALLNSKPKEITTYLKKNIDFIDGFLNHLDAAPVTDFFTKLIHINSPEEGIETIAWIIEIGFVDEIFKRLEKDYAYMHSDVAQATIDILNAATWNSDLSDRMMTYDSFSFLMEIMLNNENPTGFIYGSKIVNKILRNIVTINDDTNDTKRQKVEITASLTELNQPVQILLSHFSRLAELLVSPPVSTTKNCERPGGTVQALGFYRLQLLSIFDTLLLLNYQSVIMEFLESDSVLPAIVETFFKFEHNTFGHKIIERFFVRVLQQITIFSLDPSKLLTKTRLIERLQSTHEEAKKFLAAKKPTKQYVPITYNIGECLNQISEKDETMKEILDKISGWKEYVEFLKQRREKLDVPPVIEPTSGNIGGGERDDAITAPAFESIIANDNDFSPYSEGLERADDARFDLDITEDMTSDDDADDYDVEQAEILLTKQEVQVA